MEIENPLLETEIRPEAIAVTMTTSYPNWYSGSPRSVADTDKIRGDLGLELIRKAADKGYRVVLADTGSPEEFRSEVLSLPVKLLERKADGTRAKGRKLAIQTASTTEGIKAIVRTEPEKTSLLDSVSGIVLPILRGQADIVIPKRRIEDFQASCPPYMFESETQANRRYNKILRDFNMLEEGDEDLDIFFGPTVIGNKPEVIALFLEEFAYDPDTTVPKEVRKYVSPDDFSNSQMYAVVKALELGMRVKSVEIPFAYPPSQRENEMVNMDKFKNKRKTQKWSILDELVLFIRYLRDPDSPKNVLRRIS